MFFLLSTKQDVNNSYHDFGSFVIHYIDMETEQANFKSHINLKVLLSILGAVVVIATFALLIHKPSPAIDPTGSAINKSEIIKNEKFLSGNILSVNPAAGSGSGVITIRANILDVSTKEDFIQKTKDK